MKLLHTSDWHLGMVLRGGMTYCDDQRFIIDKICQIAVREKVDGIIIAGDIFDKSIASSEAIRIYDEVMTYICSGLGIPVYLVAGNHDGAERISQCSELLKKSGLYIAGAISDRIHTVNSGDVDIYLLPWISTDKVKSIYPDKADQVNSMEDAYRVVLDEYRKTFVKGHKNILAAHAFIVNAETSVSDRAAEVGSATMVGTSVFEGFDYVALGHLHGPQDINDKIRYSGSIMAYSFGKEEKQEKSVTIIDTDDLSHKIIPLPQLHKRTTISGTYREIMEAGYDEEIIDGYVKLEVTDSYVGMDSIASLREKYKNLLEITSRAFDKDDEKITLTMEEFENINTDPESVFKRYCQDTMSEAPGRHLEQLFMNALQKYEREAGEE